MLNRTEFMSEKRTKKKIDFKEKKCTSSEEEMDNFFPNCQSTTKPRRKKSTRVNKSPHSTLSHVAIKSRNKIHSSLCESHKISESADKKSKKSKEIKTLFTGNDECSKRPQERGPRNSCLKNEKRAPNKYEIRDKSRSQNKYSKNFKKLLNYSNDFHDQNLKSCLMSEPNLYEQDERISCDVYQLNMQPQIFKESSKRKNSTKVKRNFSDESKRTFSDALSVLSCQYGELNKKRLQTLIKCSSMKDDKSKNFVHRTKKRICPKILRASKTKRSTDFGHKCIHEKKSVNVLDLTDSDEDLRDLKLNELDELDEEDLRELYENSSACSVSKVHSEKPWVQTESLSNRNSVHSSFQKDDQLMGDSVSKVNCKNSLYRKKNFKVAACENYQNSSKTKLPQNENKAMKNGNKNNSCIKEDVSSKKEWCESTVNSKKKRNSKKVASGISKCPLDSKSSIQFCHMIVDQLPDAKIIPFEALSEILPKEELDKVNNKIDENIENKQILLPGIFEDTQSHIDRIKQQVLKKAKECLPSATFSKINQFLSSNRSGNCNELTEKLRTRKEVSHSVPSFKEKNKSSQKHSSYHEIKTKASLLTVKKKHLRTSVTSYHGDSIPWKRYGRKPDTISNSYYCHLYSVYSDGKQRHRLRGKTGRKFASDNVLGDKHFKRKNQLKERHDVKSEDEVAKKECNKTKGFNQKLGRQKMNECFIKVCQNCNTESCTCKAFKNALFQIKHNFLWNPNLCAIHNRSQFLLNSSAELNHNNGSHEHYLNARQYKLLKSRILDKGDSNVLDLDFLKSRTCFKEVLKNPESFNHLFQPHTYNLIKGSHFKRSSQSNYSEGFKKDSDSNNFHSNQFCLHDFTLKTKQRQLKSRSKDESKTTVKTKNKSEKYLGKEYINHSKISNHYSVTKQSESNRGNGIEDEDPKELFSKQRKNHSFSQSLRKKSIRNMINDRNSVSSFAQHFEEEKIKLNDISENKREKNICTVRNANDELLNCSGLNHFKYIPENKLTKSIKGDSISLSSSLPSYPFLGESMRETILQNLYLYNNIRNCKKSEVVSFNFNEQRSNFFRPEIVNFSKNSYCGQAQLLDVECSKVGNYKSIKSLQPLRDSRNKTKANLSSTNFASEVLDLNQKFSIEKNGSKMAVRPNLKNHSQVQNETTVLQSEIILKSMLDRSNLVHVPDVRPPPGTPISLLSNQLNTSEVKSSRQRVHQLNKMWELNSTKGDSEFSTVFVEQDLPSEKCSTICISPKSFKVCNFQKYKLLLDLKFVNSVLNKKLNCVGVMRLIHEPLIYKWPHSNVYFELLIKESLSNSSLLSTLIPSTSSLHFFGEKIQFFKSSHFATNPEQVLNLSQDLLTHPFFLNLFKNWPHLHSLQPEVKVNIFTEDSLRKSTAAKKTTSCSVQTDLSLISPDDFNFFLKTSCKHCLSIKS